MPSSPPDSPPLLGEEPFGALLSRFRLARGWSQSRLAAELCAAAGVPTLSRHEISRWERQRRVPGPFWRSWLAQVLALPADLLPDATEGGRDRRARRPRAPRHPPTRPATRAVSRCATARRDTGGSARRDRNR
ncbi:hypothetical protein GCM10011608_23350 [Micromonospora sonchi]|uniref:HTH cro/C1-type domain-containing protein n=1 Tax=Micromonospora sonchi TaxID=1763543 RepID=A0A917TTX7_9ACTN|nr:helix-turn-helix transcriptional regulator [Micromonospora sonchi]GGM38031.1 hypothetical protein GCM10011608_23350 [Micromonospora sonchi]